MFSAGREVLIGVIDYQTGNAQSVGHALNHVRIPNRLVRSPQEAAGVDRFILPGVGAAGTTMKYLAEVGWPGFLEERILGEKIPFLGICVGLQVLFEYSVEQETACLGWLSGRVVPFDAAQVRVPQIGWNEVQPQSAHPIVRNMPAAGHFYFVNSYYAVPDLPTDIAGITEYQTAFPSVVARDNVMATQFHAEKSGPLGLELLTRFAAFGKGESC